MRTRKEIQDEIEVTLLAINSIKMQLETYSGTKDKDWVSRTRCSLKYKQMHHQKLLRELGDIKKQEFELRSKSFERIFITVAEEVLDSDMYNELVAESSRRLRNNNNSNGNSSNGNSSNIDAIEKVSKARFLRLFGFG
jgi:hypothetical protein